jgi:hypothetical protein
MNYKEFGEKVKSILLDDNHDLLKCIVDLGFHPYTLGLHVGCQGQNCIDCWKNSLKEVNERADTTLVNQEQFKNVLDVIMKQGRANGYMEG